LPSGQEIKAGDSGSTDSLVDGAQTAWVASNHPVLTTYQGCAKDPKCTSTSFPDSWHLVADERLDFLVACRMRLTYAYPENPFAQNAQCEALVDSMVSERCAQARLDYNFYSDGNCHCPLAAKNFCEANQQQACPNGSEGPYLSCDQSNASAGCPDRAPSTWFRCPSKQ
jgi:hypothetical protein